ncbi:MAG: sugar ABC transporter permease [Candidatus Sumerlaeaceae bacterium]|nr:sugar ABC transporter permease [Candidatus Sumerlaeaceae bacterium]
MNSGKPWTQDRLRTLLQAPAVGLLFLWMIVPLGMTIYFSFIRYILVNPDAKGFVGLDNYRFLWKDPSFVPAVLNTVVLIGSVLAITLVLGTLMAVLYGRGFPGRNVALLLVIAPFFVMPTVSALVWKNMIMHPVYGLLARGFALIGQPPVDWFGAHPMMSIIIILSWEWFPFAFLVLYTSLKSLDQEQTEAAVIDGANSVQLFLRIIIPHLKRAMGVVIMIETIFLLSIFAEIHITTSGGPGTATTNIAYLVYSLGLQQFDVGIGSAGGILAVVVANVAALFLLRITAKSLRGDG